MRLVRALSRIRCRSRCLSRCRVPTLRAGYAGGREASRRLGEGGSPVGYNLFVSRPPHLRYVLGEGWLSCLNSVVGGELGERGRRGFVMVAVEVTWVIFVVEFGALMEGIFLWGLGRWKEMKFFGRLLRIRTSAWRNCRFVEFTGVCLRMTSKRIVSGFGEMVTPLHVALRSEKSVPTRKHAEISISSTTASVILFSFRRTSSDARV